MTPMQEKVATVLEAAGLSVRREPAPHERGREVVRAEGTAVLVVCFPDGGFSVVGQESAKVLVALAAAGVPGACVPRSC